MLQSYCYDSVNYSFRKISKKKVFNCLQNSFQEENFEKACHWSAEIDLSGWQYEYFDFCFIYISDQIHLINPKLPFYIFAFFQKFIELKKMLISNQNNNINTNDNKSNENINLSFNLEWRKIWIHITGIISLSSKQSIRPLSRGNLTDLNFLMTSSDSMILHPWTDQLPERHQNNEQIKVMLIITSFLCKYIEEGNEEKVRKMIALFVEVEIHIKSKKQKMNFHCIPRNNLPSYDTIENTPLSVNNNKRKKLKDTDWTNLIWDVLEYAAKLRGNIIIINCISSLHVFFYLGFHTINERNKRMSILLHAIMYLYPIHEDIQKRFLSPIIPEIHKKLIFTAIENIDIMYQEIYRTNELNNNKSNLIVNPFVQEQINSNSEHYLNHCLQEEQSLFNNHNIYFDKYLNKNTEETQKSTDQTFNFNKYSDEKIKNLQELYFHHKKIPKNLMDRLALLASVDKYFQINVRQTFKHMFEI